MSEPVDTHLQELRRGTVVLACLQLLRTPGYGYALLEQLESLGFATDANTLYPLLRRLEKQGFLTSAWNTEDARPRKFYATSAEGSGLADTLTREWCALTAAISGLTAEDPAAAPPGTQATHSSSITPGTPTRSTTTGSTSTDATTTGATSTDASTDEEH